MRRRGSPRLLILCALATLAGACDGEPAPAPDVAHPPDVPPDAAGSSGDASHAAPKGLAVRGRVTLPDGSPAAGATVWVHTSAARVLRRAPASSWRTDHRGVERARSAFTDHAGAFEIEGESGGLDLDVYAERDGHARTAYVERMRAGGEPVTLRLRERATARLTLRRAGELRAEDCTVAVRSLERVWRWEGRPAAGGALPTTLGIGPHLATVTAPGAPAIRVRFGTAEGEASEIVATLRPEPYLEGRLVDDAGEPISRYAVVCDGDGSTWKSRTAVDGSFLIEGVTDARPDLVVRARSGREMVRFTSAKPPESGIVLVLPRPGALTGRFVLPEGAEPPTAVTLAGDEFERTLRFTSEPFRVDDVDPGFRRIEWDVDGLLGPEAHWVHVKPAVDTDLGDVVLDAGRTLVGRVVTSNGTPVEGAELSTDTASAESGSDGSFELGRVRSSDVTVDVETPDHATLRVVVAEGATAPLAITVLRAAVLDVHVAVPRGVDAEEFADALTVRATSTAPHAADPVDEYPDAGGAGAAVVSLSIQPGPVRVEVFLDEDDPPIARADLNVTEDESRTVELTPRLPEPSDDSE